MNETRFNTGHIDRFWDDSFKDFTYVKVPPLKKEYDQYINKGYDPAYVKSFVGSMYNSSNEMPDWITKGIDNFGLTNCGYCLYRMDQLEIIPEHSDHYETYCRIFNATPDKVFRVVIMLEDWKPGHYFEIDGIGFVNWKAGDWFSWRGDVPHAAANIGTEPRYTLQITGTPMYSGQLNELFAFNVPDFIEKKHPLIDHILQKLNSGKSLDSSQHIMLYMNNRTINELKGVTHSIETRNMLNAEGLHIYLYEPLCSYDIEKIHHAESLNPSFYSEFDKSITPERIRAEELDSIYDYAILNSLENVSVHTCDYNIEIWYTHYADKLKLYCNDVFVMSQPEIITDINENIPNQFMYDYICLNWRYTKHRQLIGTFLASTKGHLSLYFKANIETLGNDLFFDIESWKTKYPQHYERLVRGCEIVENEAPFYVDKFSTSVIDTNQVHYDIWPKVIELLPEESPSLYNYSVNTLSQFYSEIFIDVVTETRYAQPTANISEKTFQPIQYFRPFILVAPPKSLEELRLLGFKTFGEFWDESYDDEFDHGERLAKIFTLLDSIFKMTKDEKMQLYKKMIPTLNHNLNLFKELIKK